MDPDSRLGVRVRELERGILRQFGFTSERNLEYDFVCRHVTQKGLSILDVGGVGSLLPLRLARSGHSVTVCDIRRYPEKHANLRVIQGDFLRVCFPRETFDLAVLVSTIEHVGYGHYGDPLLEGGDIACVQKTWELLRGGRRLILTTPFTAKERIIEGYERWYDEERLTQLLEGFDVSVLEFWVPKSWVKGRCIRWVRTTIEEAKRAEVLYHYHADACVVGTKWPRLRRAGQGSRRTASTEGRDKTKPPAVGHQVEGDGNICAKIREMQHSGGRAPAGRERSGGV